MVSGPETQSPATAPPRIIPSAVKNPPRRTPAAELLSTVTASEITEKVSRTSQRKKNPQVERRPQNMTTSAPGPFPIFAPAKHSVTPINEPLTTHDAAEFLLSTTSSRALIPR